MTKKAKSKSKELYFTKYQTSGKHASNRKRKLLKLQKEHPNNTQITSALNDIHYRRGTPKVGIWSHSDIATAKLFKKFTGKFDRGVLVPVIDERSTKIHAAAVRVRNEEVFKQYKAPKLSKQSMFALMERAHSSNGMRVWI